VCSATHVLLSVKLVNLDTKLLPFFYKKRAAIHLAHEVFDQMLVP
jgi:hypothetical protein